jgi:hypothetical protein
VQTQSITYAIRPTATTAEIQAIMSMAEAGSRIVFSPGTYTAPNDGWLLGSDDVQIDASRARFTQSTWRRPVFDLMHRNGVGIDVGHAEYIGTSGTPGSAYRGSNGYNSCAVVWCNGDDNYIRVRYLDGFVCAVYLSS